MYAQFFPENNNPKVEELIQACMSGNVEQVKKLTESGVDINAINPEYGDTALSQAALQGYPNIVDFLLTKQISPYSKNLALIFACQKGHLAIIDKFLQHGADVNAYIEDYHTPLFQAIAQNKMDVFKRLLNEGAINVNLVDKEGVIPLLLAAYNGHLEMVKQLVDKGADLSVKNKGGCTVKDIAKQKKHNKIIEYLENKEKEIVIIQAGR
jgi:ankyrin repeat protein